MSRCVFVFVDLAKLNNNGFVECLCCNKRLCDCVHVCPQKLNQSRHYFHSNCWSCVPQPGHHNTDMKATFAPLEARLKPVCLSYRVHCGPAGVWTCYTLTLCMLQKSSQNINVMVLIVLLLSHLSDLNSDHMR